MDESPTRYMLPPEESSGVEGTVSFQYGDVSPARYPTFKTKKRKNKKTVPEKKKKTKSKGKEEEFDPDAFLETLSKPTQEPATQCPMCVIHPEEFLERRQADTQYGPWEYYKCPVQGCFVCCGEKDNVQDYVDSVQRQLHQFYHRLPLEQMKCFCERPLIMTLSHSEKNPGRLFLKCSKRWCDFFQWVDEVPRAKNRIWLKEGRKSWLETPLQQGVRHIVDKHLGRATGPLERSCDSQELSPKTKQGLDRIIPRFKEDNYVLDEFTPKERHYMLKRGLVISDSM